MAGSGMLSNTSG